MTSIDDEAADQVADLGGDDRDRRQQRVAQHVAADDRPLRQALEDRGAGVVGVERLDRPGARHARDVAEEHEDEAERRQRSGTRSASAAPAPSGGRSGHRQDARARARRPGSRSTAHTNSGIAVAERPPTEISAVARLPSLQRGDHAAEDPERHDEHERQTGELGGVQQRGPDDRPQTGRFVETEAPRGRRSRSLRASRSSCTTSGPVGPQLLVERVDGRLVGERPEDAPRDVARQHLGGDEDDDAQRARA